MSSQYDYGVNSRDNTKNMIKVLSKCSSGLKVCHINAQSLNNKMDQLRYVFMDSDIDIICVSETWFQYDVVTGIFDLPGYKIFRCDRKKHGGGVAVYVKKHINATIKIKSDPTSKIDFIFLDVTLPSTKILAGCVYRPKKYINIEPLIDILTQLTVQYENIIIAGDFNSNLLCESNLTSALEALRIVPVNTQTPTHFTNTNDSLLDLFLVNDIHKVTRYDQLSASMFSKHDLIFICLKVSTNSQVEEITYRDYKNLNLPLLEQQIMTIPWNDIYSMPSVDCQAEFLQVNLCQLYDEHIPLRTKKLNPSELPWFHNEIKQLIAERNSAYGHWKRYKLSYFYELYRQKRKIIVKLVKNAKSSYYRTKFQGALDSKKKWKEIKNAGIIGKNEHKIVSNVEELNTVFTTLPSSTTNLRFYDDIQNNESTSSFEFQRVTQSDVVLAMKSIKSTAIGADGIDPKFLKIIIPWIIDYITHLFNSIITTSSFPSIWKYAKIVPIPKSNTEYRPIAILPFISKILEKILHNQLSVYLNSNRLLTDCQSGFRAKRSCLTVLTDVSEEIRRTLDKNEIAFLLLLDHSKAFDTVDHKMLALKMKKFFNLSATAVKLFSSYLSGRRQSVFSGPNSSGWLPVNRGVPQGSILGPLLFCMYSNDLPLQLKDMMIWMYADDAQLLISTTIASIDSCVLKINADLRKVYEWASANGLNINSSKSKCLPICRKQLEESMDINITLGESRIAIETKSKNLGIVFNNKLSWADHIRQTSGRVYNMLRSLWLSQSFTPIKIRMLLAKTYLVPTLMFGCEIFSASNASDIQKLNSTFNSITRYIFGLKRYDSVSEFAKQLYSVSFVNLLNCRCLILLHKIINTKEPEYLYKRIQFARSSRGKTIIQFRHKYRVSEMQFFIRTIRLWNNLPYNIQTISSTAKFKDAIFKYYD